MDSKYRDSFDLEEFKLFIKYNNKGERSARHIDAYLLDDSLTEQELNSRIEYNKLKLEQSLVDQIVKGEFSEEKSRGGSVCGECTECEPEKNTQVDGEADPQV